VIKDDLAALLRDAAAAAAAAGDLPELTVPEDALERPQNPEHGDYASPAALKLARAARLSPLKIAEALVAHLPPAPYLAGAAVAPPGFINFRLDERWLQQQVDAIVAAGADYGKAAPARESVQVEFVSANPTGPLTVGNGRGAVYGSTLAAVLAAAGYRVEREYYVNDAGTQIETFARTLYARYQQLFGRAVEIPPDGYPGEYVRELASRIHEAHGDAFLRPEGEPAPDRLAEVGIDLMVETIRDDLATLGVDFDVWFRERTLYAPGAQYERTMALLRDRGYIVNKEGATWFSSGDLGEDRENVLVRSSGAPTYFASDIAYHYNKLVERGFERVIDIWGADHHGHVSRMKAAVSALGVDPERLTILIYQLVTVRRGGEVVRLSKRAGEIILLRDLLDEVGADACRFFFLQRSPDSTLDFDIDLAKEQSDKNPVYYVQYAHARIAGVLRQAAERGFTDEGADVALLTHPAELALTREMLRLPEIIENAARGLAPHLLPYFAQDLASAFHAFYRDCQVVATPSAPVPEPLTRARLRLVHAARVTLANTLGLMGMTAPERM
jgi:arginyl-tRNA synthetase